MNTQGAIDALKFSIGYEMKEMSAPDVYWIEALTLAVKALQKQISCPPKDFVRDGFEALGKNFYCQCGVMFPGWHHERGRTNYCGNCGQKLREVGE